MNANQQRSDACRDFAQAALAGSELDIKAASSDASFRSYWRVRSATGPARIVMDAPPGKEDIGPWLDIGQRLRDAGLHVPEVFAIDRARGFILMEDLGARAYLPELNNTTVDDLYADALSALHRMQTGVNPITLPAFDDAFMRTELELMPEWFLGHHLGHGMAADERALIGTAFDILVNAVREQPQVFMHRDYHSRNLMIAGNAQPDNHAFALHNPGIIDFQDAMLGPVTYDLVSLLRDCYIAWDPARVERWMEAYRQRLRQAALIDDAVDARKFRRWFDLTGVQRHLKVLGVFCRLCYRDGKTQYLGDLPRVWRYVMTVARSYRELAPLTDFLEHALGDRDIARPRAATSSP